MADPGFPRGGGANSPGAPTYEFAKISQKLHEIERIWALGGVPRAPLMVYSHWLGPEPGPGRMGCMILCRTFHITPGPGPGSSLGKTQMGAIPIFQVLKIFPVMSYNWFQLQYLCFLYFFTGVCSQNGTNL